MREIFYNVSALQVDSNVAINCYKLVISLKISFNYELNICFSWVSWD